MSPNKKAAACGATATTDQRCRTYPARQCLSRRFQKIPNRPEIQKPQECAANCDPDLGDALGLLLIGLQRDDLSLCEQRRGWALAERWMGQFIEAKHQRGAA